MRKIKFGKTSLEEEKDLLSNSVSQRTFLGPPGEGNRSSMENKSFYCHIRSGKAGLHRVKWVFSCSTSQNLQFADVYYKFPSRCRDLIDIETPCIGKKALRRIAV